MKTQELWASGSFLPFGTNLRNACFVHKGSSVSPVKADEEIGGPAGDQSRALNSPVWVCSCLGILLKRQISPTLITHPGFFSTVILFMFSRDIVPNESFATLLTYIGPLSTVVSFMCSKSLRNMKAFTRCLHT